MPRSSGVRQPTCSSRDMAMSVFERRTSRILAAVQKLKELDDEFDVANAAVSRFDFDLGGARRERALLDPALHGLDLADLGRAEIAAINEGRDRREEGPAEIEIARDGPTFDERLTFPRSTGRFIIAERRGERARQRALIALGSKPHVDPIGDAQRGVVGEQSDDFATHPREKFGVGDDARTGGLPFGVVQENQVDVRAVIQLVAAELAERQDDERGGVAVGTAGPSVPRLGTLTREPVRRLRRRHRQVRTDLA